MPPDARLHHVVSRDGTKIAVEQMGRGRPLLLVHGTSSKRGRWAPILNELASNREVFWMDRRGRGDSADVQPYAIEREFEDVAVIVDHIGCEVDVFGHSYGAICALMATALTPSIGKLVLYEPPIGAVPTNLTAPDTIDWQVSEGDLSGGLEIFLSQVLNIPTERIELMKRGPDWSKRLDVVPTIARELRAVQQLTIPAGRIRTVANKTLLVQGGDSPSAFQAAINLLSANLPDSDVVILDGQQHQAIDTAPDVLLSRIGPFLDTSINI